jgi:hypothetical protein
MEWGQKGFVRRGRLMRLHCMQRAGHTETRAVSNEGPREAPSPQEQAQQAPHVREPEQVNSPKRGGRRRASTTLCKDVCSDVSKFSRRNRWEVVRAETTSGSSSEV